MNRRLTELQGRGSAAASDVLRLCLPIAGDCFPCIIKLSASERGVDAASLALLPQLSLNSNLVGSFTLKRPDRRRAEAALGRAAKAEGRAPTNRQLRDAPDGLRSLPFLFCS